MRTFSILGRTRVLEKCLAVGTKQDAAEGSSVAIEGRGAKSLGGPELLDSHFNRDH